MKKNIAIFLLIVASFALVFKFVIWDNSEPMRNNYQTEATEAVSDELAQPNSENDDFARTMKKHSKKVGLNRKSLFLRLGNSYTLSVRNNKKKVTWSSANKGIATVNNKGKVKGLREGNTKVTAKIKGKSFSCKVYVRQGVQASESEPNKKGEGGTYSFRSKSQLKSHYIKHGKETKSSSEAEYLQKANAVISNPMSKHKLESEDNDHIYYLEESNEITFVSQDGYIRTYFVCDGKDYFERQ